MCSVGLKYTNNALTALGELMTLHQTPYLVGDGTHPPHFPPLGAFGAQLLWPQCKNSGYVPERK